MGIINQLEYLLKAKEFLSFLILIIVIILIIKLLYHYFDNLINKRKIELIKKEVINLLNGYFAKNKVLKDEKQLEKIEKIFSSYLKNSEFKRFIFDIIRKQLEEITKMFKLELNELQNQNEKEREKLRKDIFEILIKIEKILVLLNHLNEQINYISHEIPSNKIKKL